VTLAGIRIVSPWDVRRAACMLYPNQKSLQRKWLHAWRLAPGARCCVGKLSDAEHMHRQRQQALFYLRYRSTRGYALDRPLHKHHKLAEVHEVPPKADRIRRVK
jgi:hypothetical protein